MRLGILEANAGCRSRPGRGRGALRWSDRAQVSTSGRSASPSRGSPGLGPEQTRTFTGRIWIRSTCWRGSSHFSSTVKSTCSARALASARPPGSCTGSGACRRPGSSTSTRRTVVSRPTSARSTSASRAASTASMPSPAADCRARPGSSSTPAKARRLQGDTRVATIKIGCEELSLIEFELYPSFDGPELHSHDDHTDAFYVLAGRDPRPARRHELRGRPRQLRGSDAGCRTHLHERPRRRPDAQRPRAGHGLPRPAASDTLTIWTSVAPRR